MLFSFLEIQFIAHVMHSRALCWSTFCTSAYLRRCCTDLFPSSQPNHCTSETQQLSSAQPSLSNCSSHISFLIPPQRQWGPSRSRESPRSPHELLFPPSSIIPETESVCDEIHAEPSYAGEMRRADAIISLLDNGTYRGASYWDVALSTAAAAKGYHLDELPLYIGVYISVVEGYIIRHSIAEMMHAAAQAAIGMHRRSGG
eukprot:TRINITY_DN1103_c2_g1_i1.p1 TRINITY_DN1103_c2_g1~~TRINITY_DN1103_c2_g1_i1.p1  ORF type:complete len:201 (+),score=27.97 TRINITY_DN1103_c2_g1_i1:67-669(+)